jgi:hypothetical protein
MNSNPERVTCTEKKSVFLLATTGNVTNGGKDYQHQKCIILVFGH